MPQVLRSQIQPVLCGSGNQREAFCQYDIPVTVLKSLFPPRLIPVIDRIFEIPELLRLANIVSLGENQFHHIIRMADWAVQIPEPILEELGVTWDTLVTAILFHDIGKGPEVDDSQLLNETIQLKSVPHSLRKYKLPNWAEYLLPLHQHIVKSVKIAESYNLEKEIIQAIALHHHIKITPQVLSLVAGPLSLTSLICNDILQFRPSQYAVRGSYLAQLLGILDQLSAIERKFRGRVYLSVEPNKLEDELVKDLVIGVADKNDPRLNILGLSINGQESVILLDLCSFGQYVLTHTEYQVQSVKKEILNTIRSLIRVNSSLRVRDIVGLIGGDEFVIITTVTHPAVIKKVIERVTTAIKVRTGFNCRVGVGTGDDICENFHKARYKVNMMKETLKKIKYKFET